MSAPILLGLRIILAITLYAFLGWGLYTLWIDLRRQSQVIITTRKAPELTLAQPSSGDPESFYRFQSPEIILGRDPASDCHLEDKTISAQHARLSYHHSHWWVEDLNSTNGTFLNHQPVNEPLVLTSGDTLRFGQVEMSVLLEQEQDV